MTPLDADAGAARVEPSSRATIRGRSGTGDEERALDDELAVQIAENKAAVTRVYVMAAVALGVVALLGIVLTLLVGPAALLLVLVAGGAAAGGWQVLRGADARVIAACGAQPADEAAHARLHNIVEGLCSSTGIPRPALYVVDDAAPNTFAIGIDPRHPSIVVTRGLLDTLLPIELEGVLAQQLSHVRALDTQPATLAVLVAPLRARLPELREWLADRGAIAITRYPPGLLGALEKIAAGESIADRSAPALAHIWTGPPAVSSAALQIRIDALREL